MFDLPASTVVNRFLPKEKFYKKTTMSSKLRSAFTDEIEKITWTHKLSHDTLNIAADDMLAELQIFEVLLKSDIISKAVLRHIDSAIPYPIIYLLHKPGSPATQVITSLAALKKEYGMKTKNDDFITTGWSQPDAPFVLHGAKLSHMYVGYLFQIMGIQQRPYSDPKRAIEEWERSIELRKQIEAINKKIASEPSVAKKQELARERYALEKLLK